MEHRINLVLDLRSLAEETAALRAKQALHKDDGDLPEYGGN